MGMAYVKKWNKVLITSIVIILLSSIFWMFREQIMLAIGDYLIIQDELHTSDVIHVIAGEDYRTEYAVQLFKQGYAPVIFFTGGWCSTYGYYHAAHARELAISLGVPFEAIVVDDSEVTSTYSETVLLKSWIDQESIAINSVIMVSDPFHMRRLQWTGRKVLGNEAELLMAPVAFDATPYDREWWKNEWSQNYVKDEYLKLIYYIARYQLSFGFIQEWLASFDKE